MLKAKYFFLHMINSVYFYYYYCYYYIYYYILYAFALKS